MVTTQYGNGLNDINREEIEDMKKGKVIITIVLVVLGVLIIDTAQALIFNNSPIIRIRENYNGGNLYCKDKGILVDTYTCSTGKKYTTFKGGSYSCSDYQPLF